MQLFCACTFNQNDVQNQNSVKKNNEAEKIQIDSNYPPTQTFVIFTYFLDSSGYIADTLKAKNVTYPVLKKAAIEFYLGKPFYKVNILNHDIFSTKDWIKGNSIYDSTNIDYEIFKHVRSLHAFYFRQKKSDKWAEDGVIEEWMFSTSKDAKLVYVEFNKIKNLIYFNTESYTFQKGNYLYVFHTRASFFDKNLLKIFTQFKDKLSLQK